MRELVRLLSGNAPSRYRQHKPLDSQKRAIRLLMENMSPKQRAEYGRRKRFEVVGGDTGRRYRIHHGNQMNIEQLDKEGRRVSVLCFTPQGDLAVGDVMLAQKIALELFETDAIKIANTIMLSHCAEHGGLVR